MLPCFVKSLLLFEPLPQNRQIPLYALPHPSCFQSLPHSQNPYIPISNIPKRLRTLEKTWGVYPLKAKLQRNSVLVRIRSERYRFIILDVATKAFSQSRHPLPGITPTYFGQTTTEAT
jgi:hypothetical protein